MQYSFIYEKGKVLQGLRYHFIWQKEIRILLIVVIIFDIVSAILYLTGKIRPEPFLLGSFIWLMFILTFWFIMPYTIYRKSATFRDKFIIEFGNNIVTLHNDKGFVQWEWSRFEKFLESPNFFHLYFSTKSFFLLPKDNMSDDMRYNLRLMFKEKIGERK